MTESPTEPPDLTAPNWAINHADGDLRESTSAALASEEARSSIAGQPLLFVTGQFAGQTIRTELREIQKADLGRKFASKDRRPLDPPPVVQVRFYRVHNFNTLVQREEELEYHDVHPEGFICSANLYDPHQSDINAASSKAERPELASGLFGATFVQCVRLTHEEQSILGFVFSDISVQREGIFVLLYQCFDIMGVPPGATRPILAESWGGSFRIYPNRQFPGLLASTQLTKSLVQQGIRTNNRREPRIRRKSMATSANATNGQIADGGAAPNEDGHTDGALDGEQPQLSTDGVGGHSHPSESKVR